MPRDSRPLLFVCLQDENAALTLTPLPSVYWISWYDPVAARYKYIQPSWYIDIRYSMDRSKIERKTARSIIAIRMHSA